MANDGQRGDGASKTVVIVLAVIAAVVLLCCVGGVLAYRFGVQPAIEELQAGILGVEGDGVEVSEVRDLPPFQRIRTEGSAEIEIHVGRDTQRVEVTIDENLLALLVTEVQDGTLVIRRSENFTSMIGEVVSIDVASLEGVTIEGIGDVVIRDLAGPNFTLEVEGIGSAELSGKVDDLTITVSGMGDVYASELVAARATVNAKGIGDVEVHATESLHANVSGMGDVKYEGEPPDVQKTIDGMGTVEPR